MAVTGTLGTALALAAPLSASADTAPVSCGSGQFLSGSIAGVDLDRLATLQAATAQNNGSQSPQVTRDPLGVSVLGNTVVNQFAGIQLDLGKVIDLGAANQYAQATKDSSSMARAAPSITMAESGPARSGPRPPAPPPST
jgi:hypothetical protein